MFNITSCQGNVDQHQTEIPLGIYWDDYNQKIDNILVKIWGNWNPHTLLVGMQNGAASMELQPLAFTQRVRHKVNHMIHQFHSWVYVPREMQIYIHIKCVNNVQKWKQLICCISIQHSMGEWINKMYMATMD